MILAPLCRRQRTSRHKSCERNFKHAATMRQRHPPNGGIMSLKMHFRDISRRDKTQDEDLRHPVSAQVHTRHHDSIRDRGATQEEGDLCRQKTRLATECRENQVAHMSDLNNMSNLSNLNEVPAARSKLSTKNDKNPEGRQPKRVVGVVVLRRCGGVA
jgi:hypothetical protein